MRILRRCAASALTLCLVSPPPAAWASVARPVRAAPAKTGPAAVAAPQARAAGLALPPALPAVPGALSAAPPSGGVAPRRPLGGDDVLLGGKGVTVGGQAPLLDPLGPKGSPGPAGTGRPRRSQENAEGKQETTATTTVSDRAKAWQPLAEQAASANEGSAAGAHGLGENIEAFLTGEVPASVDEEWAPLAPRGSGTGPRWRLLPAASRRQGRELNASEAIAVLAAWDSQPPPSPGLLGWLIKQPMDFIRLVRRRQRVYDPSLLPAVAAAMVLAPVPGAGFTAVHELGHYLMARLMGVPTYSMRYDIPDGMLTRDGSAVIQGYVVTSAWEKPYKQLAVLWAGPLAGWAYYLTAALALPLLVGALMVTPWAWAPALWNVWVLTAGWRGFWGGHYGDSLGIKRVRTEIRRAPTRILDLDSRTMETARLLARIHSMNDGREVLRRGVDMLARFSEAADAEGKATIRAGGTTFRFRVQGEKSSWPADLPPARPLASDEEDIGARVLEIIELHLGRDRARTVDRLKRDYGYPWTEEVVAGGVKLLAYLHERERTYGPVSLLEDGRFTPLRLP